MNPQIFSVSRLRAAGLFRRAVLAVILLALLFSLTPSPFPARAQLSAPVPVNPPNAETTTAVNYPPAAVPYFEWEAVPGAETYRIQIDDEIGFSVPIRYEATTPNTRHIPTTNSVFSDGTWYWRVRVEKPTPVSPWSEIRQFTKSWGNSDNAPRLLWPEDQATIEFFEAPVFSWTRVTGAADYVLKIDNDYGCPSPLATYTTLATHYNPTLRRVNGTYYWCVVPRDANGREGYPSESRMVVMEYAQAPQLLEPANGSWPVYTPRFRWTAVKGAYAYNLYYGTSPSFQTGSYTKVTTNQTSYTPLDSLPNDQDYFWRVSAVYGSGAEGPFSEVWHFQKKWYHRPMSLTPRNNELVNVALFTWTPVREAKYYKIETSFDPGFSTIKWSVTTPNTFYWRDNWKGDEWGRTMYWRVTPYDNKGYGGQPTSEPQFSFRPTYTLALPEAFYPRFFYPPPSIAAGNYIAPYNIPISYDYTMDTPTFYWSRTFIPAADPRVEADHYKIEVDDDPMFASPDWVYRTQNLSATPTDGAPFTPAPNTDYYWRVTPCDSSGAVLADSAGNVAWITQIDTLRQPAPVATASPTLQRPADGEKVMDTMPSFEWLPQQGAVRYEFALSTEAAFGTTAYVTRTIYTRHTPSVRFPKGTYFWRVRGLDSGGNTVGQWSNARRLVVVYQTRWELARSYPTVLLPATAGTWLASDINDGQGATELTSLYATQDKDYWYLGFHVYPVPGNTVWYGLYIDGDQKDNSGASGAPSGRPALTTSAYYRPEYAIYVVYSGSQFVSDMIYLHKWDPINSRWDPEVRNLVDPVQVGGAFYYNSTNYVELKIPKTAIGDLGSSPFVLSAALFSADSQTATTAADTVPDNGHATSTLNEFKSIADRVTLALPVDSPPGYLPQLPYTPYMYAESPNTDYLAGYRIHVARDPGFSAIYHTQDFDCWGCDIYVDIFQYAFSPLRVYEDNTLYWRILLKHKSGSTSAFSPPSEPHAFTKVGLVPANLRTESGYSTPTFIWDAVEGAAAYRFQLSPNSNFSPVTLETVTNHENLTPPSAYAPGTYYWRVRAENSQGGTYQSQWSLASMINITLPVVSLVSPAPGAVVRYAPTFHWQPVLTPTAQPAWSAPKYYLQVANNPLFNPIHESATLDTVTWTPIGSYPDGTYYWRVAVQDAGGRNGPYSPVYTFTKQYPVVTLVSPLTGTMTGGFPTFIWEPVDGAAQYKIEIAKNAQFSPKFDEATTNNTRFIPTKKYDTAQYYWRVAMIDKNGKYGPWTDSIVVVNPYPYRIYLPTVKENKK